MSRFTPPFLGAAYYPEAWPLSQIDQDIARMKEAGMSVMRIAEFSWSRLEPEEGRYDLSWIRTVVDKLGEAGIATIIGTPTCTPPAWLTEKHPEILPIMDSGWQKGHGERAQRCPNVPVYREYSRKIVGVLAEEFGNDENVIGWQIDNEVHPVGPRGCCCPICVKLFHERLRERFGTIDALNETWGTHLWSQTYQSFEQIPVPDNFMRHHPSLVHAWWKFQSDSYIDFIEDQVRVLHEKVTQPVGTDMMPTNIMDWHDTHRTMDIAQFNHYNTMDDLWETTFWMDFARSMVDRPWWCTETSTCWNGGTEAKGYREPGFCRANSWLPVALGGEANLYWLWRAHWSGQELMHGSVIDSSGRPLHIFDEVREVSDGFAKAADFLNATAPVRSGLAMHLSGDAWHMFHEQPMLHGFNYKARITKDFHTPIIRAQYRPDVIDPAAPVDGYRVVMSPYLPTLEEDGVGERMLEWVRSGGTWIIGPLSDVRTVEATKYRHAPYGHLEDRAGIRGKYQIPASPRDFTYRFTGGEDVTGSVWYDSFEPVDCDVLAEYTEGPMEGLAAITRKTVGNGFIVVLGTTPREPEIATLLDLVCPEAGVRRVADASPSLLVVPRSGDGGEGLVAVEFAYREARINVEREAVDLLTGDTVSGETVVPPYGVLALRYV